MAAFELNDQNELVELPTYWSRKLKHFQAIGKKCEELEQENKKLWEQIGNKIKDQRDQGCNTDQLNAVAE